MLIYKLELRDSLPPISILSVYGQSNDPRPEFVNHLCCSVSVFILDQVRKTVNTDVNNHGRL